MIAPARVDLTGLDVEVRANANVLAVAPRTPHALAALLARCADAGAACVAVGGDTLGGFGNAPERFDVAIRTDLLAGIVQYDHRDMTASVGAGTTLRTLADHLGANGQFVPIDAPHAAQSTVGGALAAGWIGPRRALYGRPRDLVIGSSVALADGTLTKSGGMVVKNVSGYDMSKVYIGALGTLGIFASVNFKCLPLPAVRRAIIAPIENDVRARALAHVAHLPVEPAALLAVDGFAEADVDRDRPALVILFEGSSAVVDRATRETRSALGAAGVASARVIDAPQIAFQRVLDAYVAVRASGSLTVRSTGLPTTVEARRFVATRRAADHACSCETIADAMTGDLIVRFARAHDLPTAAPALLADLRVELANVVVIAGTPASREAVDAWPAPPPAFAHMRELKARFDPHRVLAPGRYVGGL